MTKITYISFDGTEHVVEARDGQSVMDAAIRNDVPGIDAECGGACACATCHVYVNADWMDKVGAASDMEKDMLIFAQDVADNSRLCCQIKVGPELNGLIVTMPENQQSAF